ncbi:MAG: right-handed parallel beta-helix repeat-containing protein [Thermoleophilia bacterium]|nr:right-handed parallel beta-helix repeat-containing protein [Thermoleophilia bacterium]
MPRLLLAALACGLALVPAASAATVTVRTEPQLQAAVAAARPGTQIALAPGRYVLTDRIRVTPAGSGTAAAPVVIRPLTVPGSVTIDANGHEEAFFVNGAHHVTIRGLRITGGAYHGVKIDAPAHHIRIQGNRMWDNTRSGDLGSQFSAIKGGGTCDPACVSDVLVDGNTITQVRPFGGNNLQGVDCNGCLRWTVRANRITNIRGAELAGTGIQFKSGSVDTVIERNVVIGSGLVGIVYGGFGTPAWGKQTHEHVGGVVRNNVVTRSADAGISVIDTVNGRVVHNTLWGNGYTPDVRRAASGLVYRNNILDRPLNLRDGTAARTGGNLVLRTPTEAGLFTAAARGDLHLRATARRAINRALPGLVRNDLDGVRRPLGPRPDIGADEFGTPVP